MVLAGGMTQTLDALVELVVNELFSGCTADVFEMVFVELHFAIAVNRSRTAPPEVAGLKAFWQYAESDVSPA